MGRDRERLRTALGTRRPCTRARRCQCATQSAPRNPGTATLRDVEPDPWGLGDRPTRPPGQPARYSETWPTSGWMRHGSAYRLRPLARPTRGSAYSSSPIPLLRTPVAADSARGSETLQQVRARRGTIWLSHQIIDLALRGPHGSPTQSSESETLWSLIEDTFAAGDATPERSPDREHSSGHPAPAPALLSDPAGPRPAPEFVEWLMDLPAGWVSNDRHGLTLSQQLTALGNGVLPLQAVTALRSAQSLARRHRGG